MKIFGFEIKRPAKDNEKPMLSVVAPSHEDGALQMVGAGGSGFYNSTIDIGGVIRNENDLINRYREISVYPEVDTAIKDVTSETISHDSHDVAIQLNMDKVEDVSENIKKKIIEAFNEVVDAMGFNERGEEIFERWYIDGRLYYQIILHEDTKLGIHELRYIDPHKIRRVKEVKAEPVAGGTAAMGLEVIDEYYVYNPEGITEAAASGLKLAVDSIAYANSGVMDPDTGLVFSHLHKAIKPANQLKMLEDAMLIYRLSRAPERRMFYIDVGNLPRIKAEQYVSEIMNRYRNKITYDAVTGEVRDDRRNLSMIEDFWLPRREGSRGTEVSTLQGGTANQSIDDVQYFKEKLYRSLNIPLNRLQASTGFNLGKASEITRDELKFAKFIDRLRSRFSSIFVGPLRAQCISRGIVTPEEWDDIEPKLKFQFSKDNYFAEFKDNEILQQRLDMVGHLDQYIGKYFSLEFVRRQILRMTDEEIAEMKDQIDAERDEIAQFQQAGAGAEGGAAGGSDNPFAPLNPERDAANADALNQMQAGNGPDGNPLGDEDDDEDEDEKSSTKSSKDIGNELKF